MAAGGCSRAPTECVIPLHSRATCLPDLRDHAVRLMKRRGRHCLGGGCDGQSKCNSDQPECCHVKLLFEAEASGWDARCASALPGGNTGTKQTTSSARRGPYRL